MDSPLDYDGGIVYTLHFIVHRYVFIRFCPISIDKILYGLLTPEKTLNNCLEALTTYNVENPFYNLDYK